MGDLCDRGPVSLVTGCRAEAGTRPDPGCSRQPYPLAELEKFA
jgi:hypothetical protein